MELDFRNSPWSQADLETPLNLTPDECQLAVLRGARWKYVHFAALPPLLFDMQNDPWEMNDLSRDPAHQSVMLEMAQKMLSWRLLHQEHVLTNLHTSATGLQDRSRTRA